MKFFQRRTSLPRPPLRLPGIVQEIFRTILFVMTVMVLFDMAAPRSLVEGSSMQPSFYNGDRLVISRLNYLVTMPGRGEIVVFNTVNPGEPAETMLIKRVIGLPGETVAFQDNQVYINGALLDEPYINEDCRSCADKTWTLKEDEYFVMGDNRNHSHDSRSFGAVPFNHIVGTVICRYFPLNRAGLITGFDYGYRTP
jgi:signal peptidase I